MGLVRKPKCGVESLGTQKTRRATLQFSLLVLLKSPSAYNIANLCDSMCAAGHEFVDCDSNICWLCRVPNGGRRAAKLAGRHAAIFARFWQCDCVHPRYG